MTGAGAGAVLVRLGADDVEAAEGRAAAAATEATEAAPSNTLGSAGGGPSLAHLLVSYLLLMNDSTLCSAGT